MTRRSTEESTSHWFSPRILPSRSNDEREGVQSLSHISTVGTTPSCPASWRPWTRPQASV
ncbi:hypothetical protein BRADI_4g15735v3 [Brachypodium distachyon]|uniref:Uncharacterized protein n=1 Tax=Brachypodium distachyon TaxID=15368 RepID=A0A2K2CN25_BRADI|nr:hypothetical protein BRADI_4g15735v3 [Brachypodium distachyon]